MVRREVRDQVIGQLAEVGRSAQKNGIDPFEAIKLAFPDVPIEVVTEATLLIESESLESWWDSVEKTIDGEIVRRALAKGK